MCACVASTCVRLWYCCDWHTCAHGNTAGRTRVCALDTIWPTHACSWYRCGPHTRVLVASLWLSHVHVCHVTLWSEHVCACGVAVVRTCVCLWCRCGQNTRVLTRYRCSQHACAHGTAVTDTRVLVWPTRTRARGLSHPQFRPVASWGHPDVTQASPPALPPL